MSIRNELETLLSISQGTAEDYNEYILRVLEEINAIEDSIFNAMSKDTQNWVNDGILAYNGNQPIPEFPKTTIQVKVKPISVITPETVVEQGTKDTLEIIPEQVSLPEIEAEIRENTENIGESILEQVSDEETMFEQELELRVPDELQAIMNGQFESINKEQAPLEVLSEVTIDYQFTPDGVFEKTSVDVIEMELSNEEFRKQEDELFGAVLPEKKKRGRKPGTKNKLKIDVVAQQTSDGSLLDVSATTVIPFENEKSLTELVEDFSKDTQGAEINEYPLATHKYKFVEESMDMETGEITPVFEITKKEENSDFDGTGMSIKELVDDFVKEEEFIKEYDKKPKTQKPLDLFRILVCQNHDKPFGEIFKLAENQSIATKKPTALVICSQIKATINTLKNLGMLKEACSE